MGVNGVADGPRVPSRPMNSGSCSRPACSGQPAASLAYDYSARCAWIDDPIDETVGGRADRSTRWPLCERHADSLRVPVGWSRVDRRAAALEDSTVEGAAYFEAGRLSSQKPARGALMPAVAMPRSHRRARSREARSSIWRRAMTRRTTTPFSPCPGFVHDFSKGDGRLVPMFSKEPLRDLLAGSRQPPCCPFAVLAFGRARFPEAVPSSSPPAELACGWGQVQVASEKGTGPMKCPNCQTRGACRYRNGRERRGSSPEQLLAVRPALVAIRRRHDARSAASSTLPL